MNFRRQPFQFNTIDPAKRQAELQKRFGLPTNNSDMYVDFLNPSLMGAGMREPSLASAGSPRLQHRLPVFTENPSKANSEQSNVDGVHKPRVRVVPIQVEGVDGDSRRHRTFSGPAGMVDGTNSIFKRRPQESFLHPDATRAEDKVKQTSQPRVCNIPIQIEPRDEKSNVQSTPDLAKKLKTEQNSSATKAEKQESSKTVPKVEKKQELSDTVLNVEVNQGPDKTVPLKQIEKVLSKLKEYGEQVERFTGTSKDKQYRYLDEMLTRCMLDLDNVETMGLDEIRKARKEAVRQVQHFVDLLDTKVNESVAKMETESSNKAVVSEDCGVPAENTSEDVEMSDTVTESKNPEDSVSADVDLAEESTASESASVVVNEAMEVSFQNKEESDSNLEVDIESTCNVPDLEVDNSGDKPGVIIEELNTNNCASEVVGENVSCIVSTAPELSVKETIAEENDSAVVIEEIETENQEIDHSINVCDSSASQNSDKKLSEQINNESCVTNTELPSVDISSVVQEEA